MSKEPIRIFFVNLVEQWKDYFADPANKFENEITELTKTLDLFYGFCNEYINHFQYTNVAYPVDWLKKKIEDTLIDYWLPLERVANQNGIPAYADELRKGNDKVLEIMKKASNLGIQTKNIHLYLEKQSVARRYPYADVFFIGIPYRDASEKKWSSLAHEFGHQIYWNSRFKVFNAFRYPLENKDSIFQGRLGSLVDKGQIPRRSKKAISILMADWFEEIFADVVGTKLLGNEYLDSSLTLARSQSKAKEDLALNDGVHPSPIIRPLVSALVLNSEATLNELQSDFKTITGITGNLQKLQIQLTKHNPKDKDILLDLEIVEQGTRIAVGLALQLIAEKRIQSFMTRKSGTSNFQSFMKEIKDMYKFKGTAEEKINEKILAPRVLEKFQRVYTVGYCPVCGSQLTAYYCASGHYYY